MSEWLAIRRRKPRATPMRTRQVGAVLFAAGGGAAPPLEFPGIRIQEPGGAKDRLFSGSLAALLHAAVIGGLLLVAWLNPAVQEEIIPVQILREEPVIEKKSEPAPAPKALAERRAVNFAPQAQAVAPQVVNPSVIAQAAPSVAAEKLEMNSVGQVVAPKEIARSAVSVETVSAVRSVAAAQTAKIDVGGAAAPALRGPIDARAPVGPSAGPRQIVTIGASVGTGSEVTPGGGSSVREGIASNRDVLGSPDGAPLASVNTRVGQGHLRGDGGSGSGIGGGAPDCFQRPEVNRYLDQVRERTLSRWALPPGAPANQQVTLRFTLDPAGSATSVEVLSSGDRTLGSSAVDALRSASPFPPMSDPARCLARTPITATFRNPVGG